MTAHAIAGAVLWATAAAVWATVALMLWRERHNPAEEDR